MLRSSGPSDHTPCPGLASEVAASAKHAAVARIVVKDDFVPVAKAEVVAVATFDRCHNRTKESDDGQMLRPCPSQAILGEVVLVVLACASAGRATSLGSDVSDIGATSAS